MLIPIVALSSRPDSLLCVYYRSKEGSDAESRKIYTIAAATGAVITVASAIYLVVAL